MKNFRFPPTLRSATPADPVIEHERAAHFVIRRVHDLVHTFEEVAKALEPESPATARHVRLLAQQFAGLGLTAVETWPQAVPDDRR